MRFQSRSLQLDELQTYTQFGCWGSDCDSQDAPAAARALAQQEALRELEEAKEAEEVAKREVAEAE